MHFLVVEVSLFIGQSFSVLEMRSAGRTVLLPQTHYSVSIAQMPVFYVEVRIEAKCFITVLFLFLDMYRFPLYLKITCCLFILDDNMSYPCEDGAIRLTGGGAPYQGRVELCYRGHWGTVCHNGWDKKDAQTVCNLLGYGASKVSIPATNNFFNSVPPEGPVFVEGVACSGNEANFLDCLSSEPGGDTCGHSRDAGVYCSGNGCVSIGMAR